MSEYKVELRSIFIVSEVTLLTGITDKNFTSKKFDGISIDVKLSINGKCERCWIHDSSVGNNHLYPTICKRCVDVVSELQDNS